MSQEPTGISGLRCADTDRELVAGVLNRAYAEGRLDYVEHDERITKAYQAKTFSDLDALTTDLVPTSSAPAAHPLLANPQPISTAQPLVQTSAAPLPTPPVGASLLAGGTFIMSSQRPGGPLHLGTHTSLSVVMGDIRLDLINATYQAQHVSLALGVSLGETRLRVPEGVIVVSNLSTIMGEYKCTGLVPGTDPITIQLTGYVFMGEVRVMGPDSQQRKYERFIR